MLNPNAKTFTFNPTATSCHFNAASTNESEGGVQDLTSSLGDFGFVNEDDADDLSVLVKGGEGLVGGAVSEGGVHYTERDYYYNITTGTNMDFQISDRPLPAPLISSVVNANIPNNDHYRGDKNNF